MDRRPEWTTAALVVLLMAAIGPLGLASGEAADEAAQALGVRRPFAVAAPLTDTLVRFAVLLPVGEAGVRPHVVAALAGALSLALLVAGLRSSSPEALRERVNAGAAVPTVAVAVAVAAGVAVLAVSRPFLEAANLRPATAVDFALLGAFAVLLDPLRRDPRRSALGLGIALACGLAAGAGWPVRVAIWPVGLAVTVWALRKGMRWPVLAPLVFVAAAAVAFGGVVAAAPEPPVTLGAMVRRLWEPTAASSASFASLPANASRAFLWLVDDVGVLVLLLAAVGWGLRLARAGADMAVPIAVGGLAAVASLVEGNLLLARLLAIAWFASATTTAVTRLPRPFGRARTAVAVVMAVVLVVPPAMMGVGSIPFAAETRSPHAVARRLDTAFQSPSTAAGGPQDGEAGRWWRYARAVRSER